MATIFEIQEEFLNIFKHGEPVSIQDNGQNSFYVCLGNDKVCVDVSDLSYSIDELKKTKNDKIIGSASVGNNTTNYYSQSGPKIFLVDNDIRGEADLGRALEWTRIMLLENNYYNNNNPHPSYTRQQKMLEDVKKNGSRKKPRGFVRLYNTLADYSIYFFSIVGFLIIGCLSIINTDFIFMFGIILLLIGVIGAGTSDNPMGLFLGWPAIGILPFLPIIIPAYFIKERLRIKTGERKYWPTRNDGLIYYGELGYAPEEIDVIKDGILGPSGLRSIFTSEINGKKLIKAVLSMARDENIAGVYTIGFSYSDRETLSRPNYNTPRDALSEHNFKKNMYGSLIHNKKNNNKNNIKTKTTKKVGSVIKNTADKVVDKLSSTEEKTGAELVDGVKINDDDYQF